MIRLSRTPEGFRVYAGTPPGSPLATIRRRRSGASQWIVTYGSHEVRYRPDGRPRQYRSLTDAVAAVMEFHGAVDDPRSVVDAMMTSEGRAAPRRRS